MPVLKKRHKSHLDPNKDVSELNLNATVASTTKKNVTKIDPPKMSERLDKFIPPVFKTPEEEEKRRKREERMKKRIERVEEWVRACEKEGCPGFR